MGFSDEDEWLLGEVKGQKHQSITAILNRKRLSLYEMDGLFIAEKNQAI
jgi:hypothetical protein